MAIEVCAGLGPADAEHLSKHEWKQARKSQNSKPSYYNKAQVHQIQTSLTPPRGTRILLSRNRSGIARRAGISFRLFRRISSSRKERLHQLFDLLRHTLSSRAPQARSQRLG